MKIYLILMIAALLLGGCSTSGPMQRGQTTGPAQVLLNQAHAEAQAGALQRAIALVERAVRIEPRNAYVWHRLAQLQLAAGNRAKAKQFARRSNQFAGENRSLKRANHRLIEQIIDTEI